MCSATEPTKVVILGAGATIGSGYKRCVRELPGDRGFFGHNEVHELLRSGRFPSLESILRSLRLGQAMETPPALGLEEVWTFLDFMHKDIFRDSVDLSTERENVWNQIRRPESSSADDHCQVKAARAEQTLAGSRFDLLMLAGWDIRRILTRVYRDIAPPTGLDPYKVLFESLKLKKPKPATFISLNYDTVLEQALTREKSPGTTGAIKRLRRAARRVCASSSRMVRSTGGSREMFRQLRSAQIRSIRSGAKVTKTMISFKQLLLNRPRRSQ